MIPNQAAGKVSVLDRIFNAILGDRSEVLEAQAEAQRRREAALASIEAIEAAEEAQALQCLKREGAASTKVSQAMRSVRPVTMPDPEELKT